MNQVFRSNRATMNSTLSSTTVKKAASLQNVLNITSKDSQTQNLDFGTEGYFYALCEKMQDGSDRLSTANNSEMISFATNNSRKHEFMQAVFEGLNRIPAKDEGMQDHEYLNKLVNNFNQPYGEYLHDLKRACEYLIRDRAKNQGGKAFTDFIQNVLHIFTAIEKLVKLCPNKDDRFEVEDVKKESTTENGMKLRQISSEFEDEINKGSASGSKYGFGAAATGAVIGTGTGASYSGLSFLVGTLANLKASAVAIASAVGIKLGAAVAITAAATAWPIAAGLVAGAAIGAGVYKGVQYTRDVDSQKRLNGLYKLSANCLKLFPSVSTENENTLITKLTKRDFDILKNNAIRHIAAKNFEARDTDGIELFKNGAQKKLKLLEILENMKWGGTDGAECTITIQKAHAKNDKKFGFNVGGDAAMKINWPNGTDEYFCFDAPSSGGDFGELGAIAATKADQHLMNADNKDAALRHNVILMYLLNGLSNQPVDVKEGNEEFLFSDMKLKARFYDSAKDTLPHSRIRVDQNGQAIFKIRGDANILLVNRQDQSDRFYLNAGVINNGSQWGSEEDIKEFTTKYNELKDENGFIDLENLETFKPLSVEHNDKLKKFSNPSGVVVDFTMTTEEYEKLLAKYHVFCVSDGISDNKKAEQKLADQPDSTVGDLNDAIDFAAKITEIGSRQCFFMLKKQQEIFQSQGEAGNFNQTEFAYLEGNSLIHYEEVSEQGKQQEYHLKIANLEDDLANDLQEQLKLNIGGWVGITAENMDKIKLPNYLQKNQWAFLTDVKEFCKKDDICFVRVSN